MAYLGRAVPGPHGRGFQFQSVASTATLLIADLHLGYAAIGTLIGLYMLPGIVIAFPGGMLSRSFGDKSVCATGLMLMIVGGLLLGCASTPTWVFAARLVSGTGAVLFNLVLTKMTTDWFAGREIVLATGVVLASWPFGIAAGLLTQPALAAAHGWRAVMGLTAAVCGLAFLLIAAVYCAPSGADTPTSSSASGTPSGMPALPPWRQMLPTIVAAVMWGNLNLALVVFFNFRPAALTALGVAPAAAAAWKGAALWVVMISVPLGGLAMQRSGRPDAAIVVFSVLGGGVLALLPAGVLPLAMGVAFGIAIGPPAGAIVSLPAREIASEHRASGLGVFLTCYYSILSAGPALAGMLRAQRGSAAAVLLAAALLAAVAPLLELFAWLAKRKGSTSLTVVESKSSPL